MVLKESVKMSKWGNSNAIRIPKAILMKLDISEEAKNVEFEIELTANNQIILTKKRSEENYLRELFEDYVVTESDKVEFDWGEPRGHELF